MKCLRCGRAEVVDYTCTSCGVEYMSREAYSKLREEAFDKALEKSMKSLGKEEWAKK